MRTLHALLAGLVCVALVVPAWAAIPKAADVPPLIEQLKKGDAKARASAAKELGHIGSVGAGIETEHANVGIRRMKRVNRIAKSALLAHLLEEPRRHSSTEHAGKDLQTEQIGIALR